MLDTRPDGGIPLVAFLLAAGERRPAAALWLGLVLDAPDHPQGACPALVFVTGVTGIAEHHLIVLAQQIGQFADVRSIGGGHPHAMHRPAVDIRADMDLHAEVPLIAFVCLLHLRVTFPFGILGRTGRMDDCGVNHRPLRHQQPFGLQQPVYPLKQARRQIVLLHEVTKVEDRCLVRQGPSHRENPRTGAGSQCRRAHPPSDGPTRRTIAEESRSAASRPSRPADDPARQPADSAARPPPTALATEPPPPSPPKTTRDASGASCSRIPDQKNSPVATSARPNLADPHNLTKSTEMANKSAVP